MASISQQASTRIKLAESQLKEIYDIFNCSQFQFTQQWRNLQDSLTNIKYSLQKSLQELESKEKHLNFMQFTIDKREKDLELREKQFNSTEKFVCNRCKTLGVKVSDIGNVVVNIEPPREFINGDDEKECDRDASVKLNFTMDGKSLQMFLNDKFDDHEFTSEDVKNAIKLSSDPAKLVLDAMEGFFPPHLKKGKLEYEGSVVRSSCVLLLEQLMELKPPIKEAVSQQARALANKWWEKVKAKRGDYMVVLGFLLLVVVFKLWSDFDKDELRSLSVVVRQHSVVHELHVRLWFLRKCEVSSTAPPNQKGETYTPPVNISVVPPVQKEEPYTCTPPVKISMAAEAQKEEPYYTPLVKISMAPPVQREEPYTSAPPVKISMTAPAQKGQSCTYTPSVKIGMAPPVQKREPYTYAPPVKISMAAPAQKGESYTYTPPIKIGMAPPVQKGEPYTYTPPVKMSMAAPAQKGESYTYIPPVKIGMAPPVQKGEPYTPPVKISIAAPAQKGEPYIDTPPVKISMAAPAQKGEPYNYTPPVKISMAPPVQKREPYKISMAAPAQTEEPYTPPVKNASVPPSTKSSTNLDTLCNSTTATGLKCYLIKNVKNLMSIGEKVLECLLYASDSAKLVFDVVQDFYLELDAIRGDINMSCCVFLLEQLMVLSPNLTTLLKEESINFAARWKARLAMTSTKPSLIFGFLKFLVAYRLSGSFQADEILALFTVLCESDDVCKFEQIPILCRALGLEEKIPELVQSLIDENKRLEAIRYICAFKLADKFPPSPLLKEYLDCTTKAAFEACKNSNNSIKAQNKCARRQIKALQSVIKCIFEFKLDFECSPIDLQQQIRQLERDKEQRKSLKPKKDKTGKKKNRAPDGPSPWSDPKTPERGPVTQSLPLEGQSQPKRPRIDCGQISGPPNLFAPRDLNID